MAFFNPQSEIRNPKSQARLFRALLYPYDAVAKNADAFDLQLHNRSRLDPAIQLQATTGFHSTRSDQIAGKDRVVPRQILDHLFKFPVHGSGIPLGPLFSIDARAHPQIVGIAQLVGSDEYRADGGAP